MQQERMCLATNFESLGVDLRRAQAVGGGGEGEKKEVWCKILACQERSGLPGKLHEGWCEELLRTRLAFARAWRGQALGIAPTERLNVRRQPAAAAVGQKEVGFAFTCHGRE